MLTYKSINQDQAIYTEDEDIEILIDCPVCGGKDCLTPDCKDVWGLTKVVLRSFFCEECDRLIFIFNEEFFRSLK